MMRLTRRTALAVIGGAAAAAVGGAVAVRSTSETGLVRHTLERYLGPVSIKVEDLEAFTEDFSADKPWLMPQGKLAQGYELATGLGIAGTARSLLPPEDRATLERFERRLLGAFHETTDFGWRQSPGDPVRYLGPVACNNPFATLTA